MMRIERARERGGIAAASFSSQATLRVSHIAEFLSPSEETHPSTRLRRRLPRASSEVLERLWPRTVARRMRRLLQLRKSTRADYPLARVR